MFCNVLCKSILFRHCRGEYIRFWEAKTIKLLFQVILLLVAMLHDKMNVWKTGKLRNSMSELLIAYIQYQLEENKKQIAYVVRKTDLF